jgi:putative pyruvate formate lyase activating enzyme
VAIVSSYGPHFGEEAPLVGRHGSGTIFFTNCNLHCIFCQNYHISHLGQGEAVSKEGIASMMLSLQKMGCHNINLVTPTHVVPLWLEALEIAARGGLDIPIVYNCGGYESVDTLKLLDGIVDIYMPDMKYSDGQNSKRLSGIEDYPEMNRAAVREMHRQVGDLQIDGRGVATRGLLIRHLVLPRGLAGTEGVLRFIAEDISQNTYVNIMDQYHPAHRALEFPELSRPLQLQEFVEAVRLARKLGLVRLDKVRARSLAL